MGALWREIKDNGPHWNTRRFFQALIFGLLFTLLDTGTDLSFAWNVPDECPLNRPAEELFKTPCGILYPKAVEFMTYTFIALPGVILGFSALQSLAARKMAAGKINGKFQAVANFVALFIQGSVYAGMCFLALLYRFWTREVPESFTQVYGFTIKAMAYISALFVICVKILGVFSHGPQTRQLVLRTTDAETRYEAALQLILVASIYLGSGSWTTRSLLSAISSLLVIGKVGVELFFEELEQEGKLLQASLPGKICVATSVLPVFVLTALFKIGTVAIVNVWDPLPYGTVLILLALVLPAFVIFLVKTCVHLEDLSVVAISQGVVAELVSLHLWPCGRTGKRIGLGVTIFQTLLFSFMLGCVIQKRELYVGSSVRVGVGDVSQLSQADVAAQIRHLWGTESSSKILEDWSRETCSRLRIASVCCLLIGWISLPLIIGQVFFQDVFVKKLADKCLDAQEEDGLGTGIFVEQGELKVVNCENEIEEMIKGKRKMIEAARKNLEREEK